MAVFDVVGESVIVMSDDDRHLHAAYNVCRHRGSQLYPVEAGRGPIRCAAGALRCPYHSWTYSLSGELLRAPHTEGLDAEEFRLHRVGVDVWAGFVFVHLTPDKASVHSAGQTRVVEHVAAANQRLARLRHRPSW